MVSPYLSPLTLEPLRGCGGHIGYIILGNQAFTVLISDASHILIDDFGEVGQAVAFQFLEPEMNMLPTNYVEEP